MTGAQKEEKTEHLKSVLWGKKQHSNCNAITLAGFIHLWLLPEPQGRVKMAEFFSQEFTSHFLFGMKETLWQ